MVFVTLLHVNRAAYFGASREKATYLDSTLPAGKASAPCSAVLYLLARRRSATRAAVGSMDGADGARCIIILIRITRLANVFVLHKGTGSSWLEGVVWHGHGIGAMWDHRLRGMLNVVVAIAVVIIVGNGVVVDVVVLGRDTVAWRGVVSRHVL